MAINRHLPAGPGTGGVPRLAGAEVDAEAGVVVGQAAHQPGLVAGRAAAGGAGVLVAGPEPGSSGDMSRVGDDLAPRPAARMAGDQDAAAAGGHGVQIGGHVDHAADHRRVGGRSSKSTTGLVFKERRQFRKDARYARFITRVGSD
jgi:hypothetical protein